MPLRTPPAGGNARPFLDAGGHVGFNLGELIGERERTDVGVLDRRETDPYALRSGDERLNEAIVKIVNTPEVADKINAMGVQARTSTSAEASALLKDETARWRQVVKVAQIPFLD